jgi:outer membrane protein OmpA-like peptidoglycan-associated protein
LEVGPGECAEYKRVTAGAERLSLNLRLRTGSPDLDNKALPDLDRMASFLGDLKYSGQNVVLIGFAEGVVTGCGAEMPVASNETDAPDALLILSAVRSRAGCVR